MSASELTDRLAVCSWSLLPTDPMDLVAKVQATGIHRVQLELDPIRDNPDTWANAPALLRQNGIEIASAMFRCVGEDYSTLESIRLTGGIAPDETWEENLQNIHGAATLAKKIGVRLVTFHAGFLPPNPSEPTYAKMLQRLDEVSDIFMVHNILLGLETGQETANELAALLHTLNHPNIGVNFDPANMLLYDKGDPVKALRKLAPWIRQVHISDARRTSVPGTWGKEAVVGEGEVDWRGFFATFKQVVLNVNLAIERESGNQRIEDIRTARRVLEETFF
jgi:sugar phosphate isomerase/epimerase